MPSALCNIMNCCPVMRMFLHGAFVLASLKSPTSPGEFLAKHFQQHCLAVHRERQTLPCRRPSHLAPEAQLRETQGVVRFMLPWQQLFCPIQTILPHYGKDPKHQMPHAPSKHLEQRIPSFSPAERLFGNVVKRSVTPCTSVNMLKEMNSKLSFIFAAKGTPSP